MDLDKLGVIERKKVAIRKIRSQVGDAAEERLMFSVIEVAISDACLPYIKRFNLKAGKFYDPNEANRKSGRAFLESDMPHAVVIGLDPQWIKDILNVLRIGGLK